MQATSNSGHRFRYPWTCHKIHRPTIPKTIPVKRKPSLKTFTLSNSLKTSFYEEEKLHKEDEPSTPTRLPVVIRRSGGVSRYLWDGDQLSLVSVDGSAFSFSSLCFDDFEDGYRKLFRLCTESVRNFFLPREISWNMSSGSLCIGFLVLLCKFSLHKHTIYHYQKPELEIERERLLKASGFIHT